MNSHPASQSILSSAVSKGGVGSFRYLSPVERHNLLENNLMEVRFFFSFQNIKHDLFFLVNVP